MGYLSSSKWFMNDEYIYDENIISQDVPNPNCIQYKNLNKEPFIFQPYGFLQFCTCFIFHGFKIILNEKTQSAILFGDEMT